MPGGVCCPLGLCCPPDKAAAALAERVGISIEAAKAVLGGFRIVPNDAPKTLHDHLDAALRDYLTARGEPLA